MNEALKRRLRQGPGEVSPDVPQRLRSAEPSSINAPDAITTSPVSVEARAAAGPDVVLSPVNGLPCVYWRLRIVEHLTARSALVHELASHEAFDLAWGADAAERPVRIRVQPESARIEAPPTLHREGTPGAAAVARAFGFSGAISVEETVIRDGDALLADGTVQDMTLGAGAFRAAAHGLELFDATLRVPSRSLGPALIPWALGTAAALLSGMGLATWTAWRFHGAHVPAKQASWHVGHSPAQLLPPELPHPRMP